MISSRDVFSESFPADLVTFAEDVFNNKTSSFVQ